VRIGDREFDYRPNVGDYIAGPRGTDSRLEDSYARLTAAQRLAARKARRRRPDDELLHMAADGSVSTVAASVAQAGPTAEELAPDPDTDVRSLDESAAAERE
jgi:hypothetical protein